MSTCKPSIRLSLLLTGNEIMSGDIVDTNSAFIASELFLNGIFVSQKLSVGDNLDSLIDAISILADKNEIVIVNGGLGSTIDDLTAEAASLVSGRELRENHIALRNVEKRFGKKFIKNNPGYARQVHKQALLPEGVKVLPNPVGIAVGFKQKIKECDFYFTPGVPHEMRAMIRESIIPDLRECFNISSELSISRFYVAGLGESQIQQIINEQVSPELLRNVELGFRAGSPSVEVKLLIRESSAKQDLERAEQAVREALADNIFSERFSLPEVIVQYLKKNEKTLAILETCTGGLLSSMVTSVPLGGEILKSGLIADIKNCQSDWLFVPEKKNKKVDGINKEQTEDLGRAMLEKTGADYVLIVIGNGYAKESRNKDSAGTVLISVGNKARINTNEFHIRQEKPIFDNYVSVVALDQLRRFFLEMPMDAFYYFDDISRAKLEGSSA
ncbi:CinA family protein [bacterium]|nr:CinA family protein [bacterium]